MDLPKCKACGRKYPVSNIVGTPTIHPYFKNEKGEWVCWCKPLDKFIENVMVPALKKVAEK